MTERLIGEDLLLLTLDDAEGKASWRQTALPKALAAALIADLYLRGRLSVPDGRLELADPTPTGDDLLDEALTLVVNRGPGEEGYKTEGWVIYVRGYVPKIRERLQERLVAKGILRRESRRTFIAFRTDRFPTADPEAEAAIRRHLRAVLLDNVDADPRTAVLIGLATASGAMGAVLDKDERVIARPRIQRLIESEPIIAAAADGVARATLGGTGKEVGGGISAVLDTFLTR